MVAEGPSRVLHFRRQLRHVETMLGSRVHYDFHRLRPGTLLDRLLAPLAWRHVVPTCEQHQDRYPARPWAHAAAVRVIDYDPGKGELLCRRLGQGDERCTATIGPPEHRDVCLVHGGLRLEPRGRCDDVSGRVRGCEGCARAAGETTAAKIVRKDDHIPLCPKLLGDPFVRS